MSKISYIHGLGASSVPADEWAQRGKEVPGRQFIPYMNMTSGQMKLALLEEQLRILAGYYPEHRSELLPAITKLENTLHAGVHGIGLLESGYSDVMRLVNKAIRQAKYNTRPGGGTFAPRVSGVGFLEEDQLETYGGGYNTTTQPGASAAPNAANELPKEDLSKYAQLPNCQKIVDELRKISPVAFAKKKSKNAELDECYHRENLVKTLNTKLEGCGHHVLYNYASNSAIGAYNIVSTKKLLQSAGLNAIANISKIEKKNLELWLRNGVMRANAKGGTQPYQPEETFNIFKTGSIEKNAGVAGIGFIDPVSFSIIVGAIISAITAAVGIIQSLRRDEQLAVQNAAGNWGSAEGGPQETDWAKLLDDANKANGLPSWLLPVGAGAAALFLLSNK